MDRIGADALTWAVAAADWTAQAASSPFAVRAYVALLAGALVGLSVHIATRQLRWIQTLTPGDFTKTVRGPPAKRKKTLERQRKELLKFSRRGVSVTLGRFSLLVLFGLVLPTVMLGEGAYWYDWLAPGHQGFVVVREGAANIPLAHPSLAQAVSFAFGQLPKGGLSDLLEVFNWNWSLIANNPLDWIVSATVVLYRLLVGGFAVVFFVVAQKLFEASRTVGQRLAELNQRIMEINNGG